MTRGKSIASHRRQQTRRHHVQEHGLSTRAPSSWSCSRPFLSTSPASSHHYHSTYTLTPLNCQPLNPKPHTVLRPRCCQVVEVLSGVAHLLGKQKGKLQPVCKLKTRASTKNVLSAKSKPLNKRQEGIMHVWNRKPKQKRVFGIRCLPRFKLLKVLRTDG